MRSDARAQPSRHPQNFPPDQAEAAISINRAIGFLNWHDKKSIDSIIATDSANHARGEPRRQEWQ